MLVNKCKRNNKVMKLLFVIINVIGDFSNFINKC